MKKTSVIIACSIVVVIIISSFLYGTRPVSAPTQSVNLISEKFTTTSAGTSTAPAVVSTTTSPTGTNLYRISQTESQVGFSIGELLREKPFTAVGTTSEVGGDIMVSKSDIKVGVISVNAKTFKTDSSRRDGAIVRFILKSDLPENELITFKPSQPITLTAPLAEGKELTTSVSGDLTISGVTKPATFNVKIAIKGELLIVTGDTTVKRSDFGLKIPELSFIANVDDAVKISISIVAGMIP